MKLIDLDHTYLFWDVLVFVVYLNFSLSESFSLSSSPPLVFLCPSTFSFASFFFICLASLSFFFLALFFLVPVSQECLRLVF
eukprot:m.33322 g.33322  ORF g.33322 m.33322 type:complete len:82 (+) comp10873_c0_seq1:645-890(+)